MERSSSDPKKNRAIAASANRKLLIVTSLFCVATTALFGCALLTKYWFTAETDLYSTHYSLFQSCTNGLCGELGHQDVVFTCEVTANPRTNSEIRTRIETLQILFAIALGVGFLAFLSMLAGCLRGSGSCGIRMATLFSFLCFGVGAAGLILFYITYDSWLFCGAEYCNYVRRNAFLSTSGCSASFGFSFFVCCGGEACALVTVLLSVFHLATGGSSSDEHSAKGTQYHPTRSPESGSPETWKTLPGSVESTHKKDDTGSVQLKALPAGATPDRRPVESALIEGSSTVAPSHGVSVSVVPSIRSSTPQRALPMPSLSFTPSPARALPKTPSQGRQPSLEAYATVRPTETASPSMRALPVTATPQLHPSPARPPPPPPGDWVFDQDSQLYWSASESLFLNTVTNQYYCPNADMWYDPGTKQWYSS